MKSFCYDFRINVNIILILYVRFRYCIVMIIIVCYYLYNCVDILFILFYFGIPEKRRSKVDVAHFSVNNRKKHVFTNVMSNGFVIALYACICF